MTQRETLGSLLSREQRKPLQVVFRRCQCDAPSVRLGKPLQPRKRNRGNVPLHRMGQGGSHSLQEAASCWQLFEGCC